jgi:hypothetical protein
MAHCATPSDHLLRAGCGRGSLLTAGARPARSSSSAYKAEVPISDHCAQSTCVHLSEEQQGDDQAREETPGEHPRPRPAGQPEPLDAEARGCLQVTYLEGDEIRPGDSDVGPLRAWDTCSSAPRPHCTWPPQTPQRSCG